MGTLSITSIESPASFTAFLSRATDFSDHFSLGGQSYTAVTTPVIPGIKDSDDALNPIGEFRAGLKRLEYVQLMPYHKLGTETYKKLGRPYLLEDVQSPTKEEMDRCRDIVRQYVKKVI